MALVQAGTQLKSEVEEIGGKVEVLDESDGLGFQRVVRLDNDALKALGDDVVEALAGDARIQETVKSSKGLKVTFVPDTRADYRDSFGLAEAVAQTS